MGGLKLHSYADSVASVVEVHSHDFLAVHMQGYTHDGNAEEQSQYCMRECHLNAAKHNPKNIEAQGPTPHRPIPVHHLTTKGKQRQTCHLEQLHTYRYTDNRNAINDTKQQIR